MDSELAVSMVRSCGELFEDQLYQRLTNNGADGNWSVRFVKLWVLDLWFEAEGVTMI